MANLTNGRHQMSRHEEFVTVSILGEVCCVHGSLAGLFRTHVCLGLCLQAASEMNLAETERDQ